MTAASGILHEEFHSPAFTATGGNFRVVQLWVNLPAKDKMTPPGYQGITDADIPAVAVPGGKVRVIAGDFAGTKGPAKSFTPINLWDVRLEKGASLKLDLPEGHNAALAVLSGKLTVNDTQAAGEAQIVLLDPAGTEVRITAQDDAMLLVLSGEPIRRADRRLWPLCDEQRGGNPPGRHRLQQWPLRPDRGRYGRLTRKTRGLPAKHGASPGAVIRERGWR